MNGQLLRLRGKSSMLKGRVGALTPEHTVEYRSVAAPGAVGAVIFECQGRCKIVRIRERHATTGAGSSVVALRRHAAGQVSAPAASVGTGVVAVASIPADSTANTWQTVATVADEEIMEDGDTLMAVTPATYAGFLVQITVVYTGNPAGA